MKCGTCGLEGHDSQGNKELCLVAVVDRCRRIELQNKRYRSALQYIGDVGKLNPIDVAKNALSEKQS